MQVEGTTPNDWPQGWLPPGMSGIAGLGPYAGMPPVSYGPGGFSGPGGASWQGGYSGQQGWVPSWQAMPGPTPALQPDQKAVIKKPKTPKEVIKFPAKVSRGGCGSLTCHLKVGGQLALMHGMANLQILHGVVSLLLCHAGEERGVEERARSLHHGLRPVVLRVGQ
jgi:hypothetical protein